MVKMANIVADALTGVDINNVVDGSGTFAELARGLRSCADVCDMLDAGGYSLSDPIEDGHAFVIAPPEPEELDQ